MQNDKMNVLLIGVSESFLLRSVSNELVSKGINTFYSAVDMKTVDYENNEYNAFIIFTDEEIDEHQQFLVYIKDLAVENDIPIFIIGYPEDITTVINMIPNYLVQKKFSRPINAHSVESDIEKFLCEHDIRTRKKILVVDDSATALRSLRTLLGSKYQVSLANSGAMAIKYLSQDHPDLILLDYEMPVLNGYQLLEIIRSESEFASTPVIFLTSKGDRESIMKVMPLKPSGYLLKTMDLTMVEKAIDDFFEKQKAYR